MTVHIGRIRAAAGPDDQDPGEAVRIAHLRGYGLLDAVPDAECQRLAALAAAMFAVPICQISVVGADMLWVKGQSGAEARCHPRSGSFCTHVLSGDGVLVVHDMGGDPRFRDHAAVTGMPGVCFYAGAPILDDRGLVLGVFCVVDIRPRPDFGAREAGLLEELAGIVGARFAQRRGPHVGRPLEGYIEAVDAALVTIDADARITSFNPAAERIFDQDRWRMIGRPVSDILPDRIADGDATGRAADGATLPLRLTISAWDGVAGTERGIWIRRARGTGDRAPPGRDMLTGLLDADGFRRCAAGSAGTDGARLLLIHLDGLGQVNDLMGHVAGDRLVRTMARRLLSMRGAGDVIGRTGGARFAMLIHAGGADRQDEMADEWRRPVRLGGDVVRVGLSIGVACADPAHPDHDRLERQADIALRCAWADGGDCVRTFDAAMAGRVAARRRMKDALRRAHVEGQFMLHYQPQVRLSDDALIGAEALLRWSVPGEGTMLPDRFLAVLETHLVAYDVGCWIIDRVCGQIARWRAAGLRTVPVAVNLFPVQVAAGTLAGVLDAAIARHGLAPGDIEIEITERIALDGPAGAEQGGQFAAIRARGYGIAFDDFGTGFASLSSLKRLPFTRLKIDRSFVTDMCRDPHSAAIVRGTIAIAHGLGARVIAEGVETVAQAEALRRAGCDEGQGYLYGRPEAEAVFVARLEVG